MKDLSLYRDVFHSTYSDKYILKLKSVEQLKNNEICNCCKILRLNNIKIYIKSQHI